MFANTPITEPTPVCSYPCNSRNNGAYTWELPRGGHKENETLMECAVRELEEETNLLSPPDYITHLGSSLTDTGILNTVVGYFYAEKHQVKYNDNEIINHKWVPVPELLAEVKLNNIQDAYTLTRLQR